MVGIAGSSEMSTRLNDVTFQRDLCILYHKSKSTFTNGFTTSTFWCRADSVLTPRSSNSRSFSHWVIHSVIPYSALPTGEQHLPKRVLHTVRARASSFSFSILYPGSAYVFFLVFPPLLSFYLSFLQ
jgi:hypothetical protein